MAKEVLAVRLEKQDIDLLKALAEKHVRPLGSELAYIIRKAAQEDQDKE